METPFPGQHNNGGDVVDACRTMSEEAPTEATNFHTNGTPTDSSGISCQAKQEGISPPPPPTTKLTLPSGGGPHWRREHGEPLHLAN